MSGGRRGPGIFAKMGATRGRVVYPGWGELRRWTQAGPCYLCNEAVPNSGVYVSWEGYICVQRVVPSRRLNGDSPLLS